jgi:predicted dehydrogenase
MQNAPNAYNRRDVLMGGALAGLGAAALSAGFAVEPLKTVRLGFVGTGGRGTGLLRNLLRLEGVKVNALCDINEANLARAQDLVQQAGQARPEGYSRGERDWQRLCDRNDLDLVLNATPWQWHAPIAVAAMKAGKHTATEVPAAQTVEECWELVETSEKTGRHCAILENDCYDRGALMILNMIRDGLLGEPLYAEGGYMHDIRAVKFNTVSNGEPWRLDHGVRRDGNLYPTHPLGPLSWLFDINRGDSFSYLVSMSSKARSLREFAARTFGAGDRRARAEYKLGDVNVTMIHTEMGRTITLYHDTNTPRPKEHLVRIQGSKGIYNTMLDKIFIDGRSSAASKRGEGWRATHEWEDPAEYKKQYDHKLWRDQETNARSGGHGGIDYMEMYRLIKNLREGKPLDIDVYDAAAWSVIVPLSEKSVAAKSRPMDIPDFTRGKWKTRAPIDPDAIV